MTLNNRSMTLNKFSNTIHTAITYHISSSE